MRIITYNVNGIRSAVKKGFIDWLNTDPADVICLQEIKAHQEDVPVKEIESTGYKVYSFSAQKKGYSGVAILTKIQPDNVTIGCQIEQSDFEGRVIRADFGDKTVINAYFPSGTTGGDRQTYKYQWLDEFLDFLNTLRKERPNLIICGDYNIAHLDMDVHNPKTNKNSGFFPEERAWMTKLFANGYVDGFRHINKDPHQYSWWSAFGGARASNKGWRIDYVNVTESLQGNLRHAEIRPDVVHSDHCPVYLEIN